MKRAKSSKVSDRNAPVLAKIQKLKESHPFWGYRRIWAHLNYVDKVHVNKKRVYRLMKEHQLIVTKNTRLKAKRIPYTSKPRAKRPNTLWGIDMTKFKTQEGWAYLVVTMDWYSKKVVGHHLSHVSRSQEWHEALKNGIQRQFPNGVRGAGLQLVSDNGCQPTSQQFMKACAQMGVQQIFTSYNNPKGNADTERMMRTLKEELIWLEEWDSIATAEKAVTSWIEEYNQHYLHSAHGYRSPVWVEENFNHEEVA